MSETLLKVLDLARWAPSGDNTQPWRFELLADDHLVVIGHDTRDHVLYDFHGHASHIAHGALLETIRLAATRFGLVARWQRRPTEEGLELVFDVRFEPSDSLREDPLVACIESRSVQRRAVQTRAIRTEHRRALEAGMPEGWQLCFHEGFAERVSLAGVLFRNAGIRLRTPEAYPVHASIIDWRQRYSEDRIPEQAVGTDRMTGLLMRWVMGSWQRVRFFNRYLLGTWLPRIQLDLVPALRCAAHIMIVAPSRPSTPDDFVQAGAVLQSLWLRCEQQGIRLQPAMTPLIFSWYVQIAEPFTHDARSWREAKEMSEGLKRRWGSDRLGRTVFWARIGYGAPAQARSLRKALASLISRGDRREG
ncbi:molybdopterin biosynthesis protein MoeY [Uliginosibacterium sp. H3]|uniref:Molybdopterin biosynthesis protein MoeY n=1 Tax=Uliginosibacterium silvisoli TaxID=3114758 RepID=A0ABU6K5Q7_9RHOO|nr:molybdopterin biosynthesis protein MoeY [Uliginosibacterium sp. H3]